MTHSGSTPKTSGSKMLIRAGRGLLEAKVIETAAAVFKTGQARWWRDKLRGIGFERIYASDLLQARRFAEIICELRGMEIESVPELREINLGQWDGLTPEEEQARFPGQFEQHGKNLARYRPPDGEKFFDL